MSSSMAALLSVPTHHHTLGSLNLPLRKTPSQIPCLASTSSSSGTDELILKSADEPSFPPGTGTSCEGCGKAEKERGCNGEGRIQGGIATVPGFGWWPIKAYRPCPAFVESGGRYKRFGQSMDDVVSGRGRSSRPLTVETDDDASSSKQKPSPRKFKR